MYYFKDHLNFTNNLQDNLYILRQRQLKEAAWSPSSGGPAVPESAAGTNELKDRMRNIKQSGDRPQSKEYLEMDAEVKRREGAASAPKATLDPSFKPAPQSSASDWRTNYDNTRALVTQDGRIIQMDKFEGQRGNIGRSGVDLVKPAVSDITRERTVVVGNPGSERLVGLADTKDGKSWVDPRDRQSAEERVKPSKPKTTVPASSPPPTPYSERGDGLATPEATTSVTPEDARSARVFAVNRMTGEGQAQQIMRAFQYTDNPLEYSPKPSQTTPPPTLQREMDKWGQGSMSNNSGGMQNANQNPVIQTPVSGEPGVLSKSYNIPDTGADSDGYGPPKPSNNIPDTGADAGGYGPPKPKADPVSVVPPSSSPKAGGRPMVMMDMDGFPVYITPPTPKPSTEYSTDIIDQGKIIMGQESVNDILDRMRNPKEISDPYEKEIYARANKAIGSHWARNRFSLKNYLESQRERAEMVKRGRENYKAEKVSSKPSWAK